MKKKIFTTFIIGSMVLSMAACGSASTNSSSVSSNNEVVQENNEKIKDPVDLTGTWKSKNNDGAWMEATINDNTISIDWVSDNGDTKSIYWVGSYTAPTEYSDEYTWTSTMIKSKQKVLSLHPLMIPRILLILILTKNFLIKHL